MFQLPDVYGQFRRPGAYAYLRKPFDLDHLVEQVWHGLTDSRRLIAASGWLTRAAWRDQLSLFARETEEILNDESNDLRFRIRLEESVLRLGAYRHDLISVCWSWRSALPTHDPGALIPATNQSEIGSASTFDPSQRNLRFAKK